MPAAVNIADRWHLSYPPGGAQACKCGRGKNRLYPSADHQRGARWRVEWTDPRTGKLQHRNRPKREGSDPDTCADAYADQVRARLRGPYVDPELVKGTFAAYAEQWRTSRIGQDPETAGNVERRFRLHVYEDPGSPGRTRRGGPALGHLTWEQLGQFPSLTQAWISGLTVASSTGSQIVSNVSSVFAAAMDDGIIGRDPTKAKSVDRPRPVKRRAVPWTEEETVAMEAALPERYRIVQLLGPMTGPRLGQVFGLAVEDVDFLKREKFIRYRVQVRPAEGRLVFAPLKNKATPDVPVTDELAAAVSAHLERFPAREVTLPWHHPADREKHGQAVTRRLIVTGERGAALDGTRWTREVWKPALAAAGLIPARERGERRWPRNRDRGTHAAWRHTAASQWLADGVEVTAVAEWLGDTVQMVVDTYMHMVPSASDRGRGAQRRYLARLESARPTSLDFPAEGTGGRLWLAARELLSCTLILQPSRWAAAFRAHPL